MHYDPILCMNVEDTVKMKDSMTFIIDVRGMDDRKVSRLIGEAQNLGFVTGDTGYTITLRGNGDIEKLKRLFPGLKLKTSNADSMKDANLPINPNKKYYSSNPNLPKLPHMQMTGSQIINESKHAYNVYQMNSKTLKKEALPYEEWFRNQWVKNFVEANDECPEGMICDESYMIRGQKFKVLRRNGDDVLLKGPDGSVNHFHIDWLMQNAKKVADNRTVDKAIEFPSEKEAIEYCKENGIDPHNIKPIGDKFVVNDKKSVLDKAIRSCDASQMFGVYYKNGNLLGFVSAPYDDWNQAKRNAFSKFGEYLNESSGAFIKRLDSEGKTMRIN